MTDLNARCAALDLGNWRPEIAAAAEALDASASTFAVMPYLAEQGFTRVGVPTALGGDGAPCSAVVHAIAEVAEESLTAAFVLWGHRCFMEYAIRSDNPALRERVMPDLLTGRRAGATGMSNAMKFLGGIEPLQITATPLPDAQGGGWRVDGKLPWVTHLRRDCFSVAAAVQFAADEPVAVFGFDSDLEGLQRSDDLPLIALRSSATAAIAFEGVKVSQTHRLHANLAQWLPDIRPPFLAYQCALSVGLARASLKQARACSASRGVLTAALDALQSRVDETTAQLAQGLDAGRFGPDPAALFRLRIALAEQVQQAVGLELQASGGRAYLEGKTDGFPRRWREAAFIPVVTPSLTQLQSQLQQHAPAAT